jgi:hypothetical protein
MPVNETPPPATKPESSLGVKILMAAVVIGFVVFHIVGDVVLRGPVVSARADSVGSNNYGD